MNVTRDDAVLLLTGIGIKSADKYDNAKLAAKLTDLIDENTQGNGAEQKKIVAGVLKAVAAGKPVGVSGGDKPGKNGEAKAHKENPGARGDKPAKKAAPDKPAKTPKEKPAPTRKVGIINEIVACVEGATTPVTKEDVLTHLTAKFPDRDPDSMLSTIHHQIPGGLRDRGIELSVTSLEGSNKKAYLVASKTGVKKPKKAAAVA